MGRKRILLALAAVAAVLLTAAVAFAEPSRNATLNASTTTYEWEDGPRSGLTGSEVANPAEMCTEQAFPCDDTLLKIETGGDFEVSADAEGLVRPDIDLYLHASNEAGEAGRLVRASENPDPDEKITVKNLQPGFYLVRAAYFSGYNVTYKGKAILKPGGTAPGGGGGGADSAPEAKLGAVAKTVKASKLKSFKGTASDDKGVAKVEVGVLQLKGSKCKELTSKGTFKKASKCGAPATFLPAAGTSTWSFKLKKRFPKGSYAVFARATDSAGQVQSGFGADNKRTFKVKK